MTLKFFPDANLEEFSIWSKTDGMVNNYLSSCNLWLIFKKYMEVSLKLLHNTLSGLPDKPLIPRVNNTMALNSFLT